MTYVEFYTNLRDYALERIAAFLADPAMCPGDIGPPGAWDSVEDSIARERALIASYEIAIGTNA